MAADLCCCYRYYDASIHMIVVMGKDSVKPLSKEYSDPDPLGPAHEVMSLSTGKIMIIDNSLFLAHCHYMCFLSKNCQHCINVPIAFVTLNQQSNISSLSPYNIIWIKITIVTNSSCRKNSMHTLNWQTKHLLIKFKPLIQSFNSRNNFPNMTKKH